jgi:hypothetical protein
LFEIFQAYTERADKRFAFRKEISAALKEAFKTAG